MKSSALLLGLLLAGCTIESPDDNDTDKWTDPETGCVYIVVDKGLGQGRVYGITIRFRADGKADCPGNRADGV